MLTKFIPAVLLFLRTLTRLALLVAWATLLVSPVRAQAIEPKLTSSVNPSTQGQAVVFKATFPRRPDASITPVTFYDGQDKLGTSTITIDNGTVSTTFVTDKLSAGTHQISATFDIFTASMEQVVVRVPDVPEADTLLLLGGGIGGLTTWLSWQWSRRKKWE
jgi:uncharacterized protein (DUF2141 family)